MRLVFHQYVVGGGCGCTPVPRKKKQRKRKNKVSNPLGLNFCKAHISKLVCAPPVFFSFIEKSTSNSTQKCEKKFRIFLTPPRGKFFFRPCRRQNHPKYGVFCGEAPSQGVRPFAVAQGASHPAFLGGWWGPVVPNPPKSYLRLVFHQYVVGGPCGCTPVPRKKRRRKRQNKVSNPLGPNFCKAHISKLVCAPPAFFSFIEKSTSNSTQKCEKFFSHFLDPPPAENFFIGHADVKITQNEGFSAAKPRLKGCGPLPLPRGQAILHFWAVGGALLSLTPKNHI